MAHAPENGCAGQERGQEAGSGQAQARAPCQAAPPRVGVQCEAWEKGSTRPSLESSPPRRPYESTLQNEVQTTTGPGPQRPAHPSTFSVCPALPARPNSQVPKHQLLLNSRPRTGSPWPRAPHFYLQRLSSPSSSSRSQLPFPLSPRLGQAPSLGSHRALGSPHPPQPRALLEMGLPPHCKAAMATRAGLRPSPSCERMPGVDGCPTKHSL